jgi:hypothetical protein
LRSKRFPAPELKAPTRDSMTTIFTQSVAIHHIHSTSPLLTRRKSPALLALLLSCDMPSFRAAQRKKNSTAQARPCRSSCAHERARSLPLSCVLRLSLSLSLSVAAGWLLLCLSLATCAQLCGQKGPNKEQNLRPFGRGVVFPLMGILGS